MVEILPEAPSFGTQIARGLGQGLGAGFSQAGDILKQRMLLESILNPQRKQSGSKSFGEQTQPGEQRPFAQALAAEATGQHGIANILMEQEKLEKKHGFEREKMAFEESKPTRTRGRELMQDLPYKENALDTMKNSIASGNLSMFSLDNLAEMSGIEGLRSPEGAQFKTASKEFFLGNLSRVGSRGLNQMMERVVLEMAPLIGRSTEANLTVTEIMQAETDVTKKEAELIHDIGQDFKEKHGYYPEDLDYRVYKELRPYAMERQKQALETVDQIKEAYEPKNKQGILMYDPSGNLRRVPHKSRKEALKEGYTIK